MGADTVKIFCPRCQSVYHPPPIRSRSSHHGVGTSSGTGAVDGAGFGTTFPHLFLMTFKNLVPDPLDSKSKYVPRVFGFRLHPSARQRIAPGPSSTTVPQGNVGRSRHASGGSAAAAGLTRTPKSRASAGGSAAAAGAAAATGPSSPPVEVGLPAVPADGKQNGKAGNGNGTFKVTRAAAGAAPAGGAGGSKSSGSGGVRAKTSATRAKEGSAGGAGAAKGGGRTRASSGEPPEKRKAASGAMANADGVKGGDAGDNNSTGSRAKRSKKAAAGAS